MLNPIEAIRGFKIMRIRYSAVLPRISTFRNFGRCGQAYSFRHEYRGQGDRAQHLQRSGFLKPVQVRYPQEVIFTIGDKFGTLLQWDSCDWERIMAYDPGLIREVSDFYQEDTMLAFDSRSIALILGEASKHNRGHTAGLRTHSIDLGTQASPLITDEDTVRAQHMAMPATMREAGMMGSSSGKRMWALHAEGFLDYIAINHWMSAYYLNGPCIRCESPVRGDSHLIGDVEYIYSKCLPVYNDHGALVYPILFGYDDAIWTGFDSMVRPENGIPGDDNQYIAMYWHFGIKLIDPRKVGVMWVRIEPIPTGGQ